MKSESFRCPDCGVALILNAHIVFGTKMVCRVCGADMKRGKVDSVTASLVSAIVEMYGSDGAARFVHFTAPPAHEGLSDGGWRDTDDDWRAAP